MQPVSIARVLRPVRGGSQAYIVQDEVGSYWIAKFLGNPQGSRTLINEFIGSSLLRMLSLSTPRLQLLELPSELRNKRAVQFKVGSGSELPSAGVHFGSAYVGHPDHTAVYDFLPQKLFSKVANLAQFGSMLVLDHWLRNVDSRQVVFSRWQEDGRHIPHAPMRAWFIDQGFMFSGSQWSFEGTPSDLQQGIYLRRALYLLFDLVQACEEMLSRVEALDEQAILALQSDIPRCWYQSSDAMLLEKLLKGVSRRRTTLRPLMDQKLRLLEQNLRRLPDSFDSTALREEQTATEISEQYDRFISEPVSAGLSGAW